MHLKTLTYLESKVVYGVNSRYEIPRAIERLKPYKICVITDRNISRIYHSYIDWLNQELNIEDTIVLEPGEKTKNIDTAIFTWKRLFENGLTRKSILIGIGGGVILDLTGFVASTYMRGIDYISIPTTLLSQADSSLGGKTGIDFIIKNGIGTFHLPRYTFIDPEFLKTLPKEEIKNGFAEIIKHSIIRGGEFYSIIRENNLESITNKKELFDKMLELSIKTKIEVINDDLHEKGLRKILNLGHTFGHAIEKASGYRIPHGYAVSIGLAIESRISREILSFNKDGEIIDILHSYGLPTDHNYDLQEILNEIKRDKKNWHGKIVMTLIESIGCCKPVEMDESTVLNILRKV